MKVLYTATVLSHICQFHLPYLEEFKNNGCTVHVAAKNNLNEKNGLQLKFTDEYFDVPFCRSPKDKKNIIAYKKLKKIINDNKYDLIICNTPMGGIITRLAAKKSRKNGTKVIYMAHGFHFYKGASSLNWLVFYPIEKIFAHLCDMVITINQEDFKIAKQKFKTDVRYVHGIGVNDKKFSPVAETEKQMLRSSLDLSSDDFVILCTGELNKNKNQHQLISAASFIKDKIPNLKILFAGNGPNKDNLINQVETLNLKNIISFLGYRTDLEKIVPITNLIVSCSRREGLPLNIIEAMLCEKPIVATYNRGHNELVKEGVNGYLVSPDNSVDMAKAIYKIFLEPDKALEFSENSKKLAQIYTLDSVKKEIDFILKDLSSCVE